ncbi:MAG: LpxI family protein [bacterium]|nr:LpxI family protein [bacterium]
MAVLGLIAGSGPLPFEVARAARDQAMEVAIAAIENNTDPEIERLIPGPISWFNAGQLGALIDFFKTSGVREVILAGAVSKRRILQNPSLLKPDERALGLLSKLAERGDDAILRALAGEFERDGLQVVDSARYLGERMTAEGRLAGPEPSPEVLEDLQLGMSVIRSLGPLDVGQAALVKDRAVLAVEAIEGTDAMVRRGSSFGKGAVLAKASKPGQDMRFDVPVIGPATIELAQECSLAAIGLEARRTLVLEREKTLDLADAAQVTVIGMRIDAS